MAFANANIPKEKWRETARTSVEDNTTLCALPKGTGPSCLAECGLSHGPGLGRSRVGTSLGTSRRLVVSKGCGVGDEDDRCFLERAVGEYSLGCQYDHYMRKAFTWDVYVIVKCAAGGYQVLYFEGWQLPQYPVLPGNKRKPTEAEQLVRDRCGQHIFSPEDDETLYDTAKEESNTIANVPRDFHMPAFLEEFNACVAVL
ncbi:hypothetical protein STEG23_006466 [Scotinomys teguina]